ncbi:MAG TPA: DUF2189 domain-containing protein [Burkholderiales bacterium]
MDQLFHPWTRAVDTPRVRNVSPSAPLRWLAAGASDLRQAAPVSLAQGVGFAAFGFVATALAWDRPHLVTVLASGFFLVAPVLAMGFYETSRRMSLGQAPGYRDAGRAWTRNPESIGLFGLVLALMIIGWERMSAILFGLFFGGSLPDAQSLLDEVLFSGEHMGFLAAYVGVGALFAAVAFALAVVTVPMLIDRNVDVVTAMMTSMKAVAANPAVMLLWAALIVALVALGIATLFAGLVITLPVVAHASWHAYRELVEQG